MSNLVLPANYIEVENEEMEYIDGGYYINNGQLRGIVYSGLGSTIGVSAVAIEAGMVGIAAAISAIPGLGFVTGTLLMANAGNFAMNAANALAQGKGIQVGVGLPTGLTFTVA